MSLISAMVENPQNLSSSTDYPFSFKIFVNSFLFFSLSLSFINTNFSLLSCCRIASIAAANSCPEGFSPFNCYISLFCLAISFFSPTTLLSRLATSSSLLLRSLCVLCHSSIKYPLKGLLKILCLLSISSSSLTISALWNSNFFWEPKAGGRTADENLPLRCFWCFNDVPGGCYLMSSLLIASIFCLNLRFYSSDYAASSFFLKRSIDRWLCYSQRDRYVDSTSFSPILMASMVISSPIFYLSFSAYYNFTVSMSICFFIKSNISMVIFQP